MRKKIILTSGLILLGLGLTGCQNSQDAVQSSNSSSSAVSSSKSELPALKHDSEENSSAAESSKQDVSSSDSEKSSDKQSSNNKEGNGDATIADIGPKTLAATVLMLGSKESSAWNNFYSKTDDKEINVSDSSESNDNYSEPGTGVAYYFTSGGMNAGEILEYRLSSDGKYVYCYQQPEKDSATRHVTPFATISAADILKHKDDSDVQDLVNELKKLA